MNKKEKVLLGGTVALGLVFASGMILANQQNQMNQVAESTVEQTTISPEQMAKYEQAAKEIKEGDEVEVNFSAGKIQDISSGKNYDMAVFPPFLQDMIDKGGLIAFVNERLEKK